MFDYQELHPRVGEQEFVVERQFTAPRTRDEHDLGLSGRVCARVASKVEE